MTATHIDKNRNDDPLRMREILIKATDLAEGHSIASVMVGMTAATGDLLFPEFVAFVESALRVDDAIFRMTRERAVLFLADVKVEQAEEIVERNLTGFRNHFPTQKRGSGCHTIDRNRVSLGRRRFDFGRSPNEIQTLAPGLASDSGFSRQKILAAEGNLLGRFADF